ncbi:MAG: metallopeptidase family protein [Gemmatimonadetes bacterium]|nr:metallopeptidase family protein [Gemmatimonadota bacterium]
MDLRDFRAMVDRMVTEMPPKYLDGVFAIEVSPKTVRHPVYPSVFTMGECIPVEAAEDPPPSRVVLYHGSFQELARERRDFDWRAEAWETLTHELRHHLEWRARSGELDAYDWAAEQNFRRQEGQPYDPLFYLSGERVADGVYCVDDDLFFDREVKRSAPERVEIEWHGQTFRSEPPPRPLPLYLALDGLDPAPVGEAFVVLRRKPGVLDLFRRAHPPTTERVRVRRG